VLVFVRLGLKVAIADVNAASLEALAKELVAAHGETNVLAMLTDVSKLEDVVRLRERVYEAWGEVSVVRRGLPSLPPLLPLSLPLFPLYFL
jgi:NAD(P)-dependent dehydrogenase (short-subunit alcohol dehydrogenase family)